VQYEERKKKEQEMTTTSTAEIDEAAGTAAERTEAIELELKPGSQDDSQLW
jgi:hypothetical protein